MGVLFNRTSQLKLLFLCFVFINNLSVTIMFSVDRPVEDEPNPTDEFLDEEDFEQRLEFDRQEIDNIKRTMIQGLGFRKVPDVTKMNVSQEEYSRMYDVYLSRLEQRQIEDEDASSENVPKFYTFHPKDRQLRRKPRRGVVQMTFNVSSTPHTSVQHSTLRLLTGNADQTGPIRVQIYQIVRRNGKRLRRIIDERDVHLVTGAPKWCEFDVTDAVRSWVENDEPNLGLELHCPECKRRGYPIIQETDSPVINALMSVQENHRGKRSAEQMLFYEKNRRTDCYNKNSKLCCRHKMDFDFGQLGFDFVLQPRKFDGGMCKGRCPPRYNAANNHAVIQSMMWKKKINLTPRVCCAPSKLNDLEILTMDEENNQKLTVKRWENMIVLECACS